MNVHEQFAEDLALYALGSLAGDERTALETHLEGCASCRRELEQLRGDMSLLSLTAAGPKPPARSRDRLLTAIASEPRRPVAGQTPVRARAWWGWVGWAAAAAMALVSIGLLQQNSSLGRDLASLRAQFNGQSADLQRAQSVIDAMRDPEADERDLLPVGTKPQQAQPRGRAIYQRRSRSLIFLASNLPALAPDKVYELWLFPASGGAPIPAGLFKPDARGNATVVNPPLPEGVEAKNFAVTVEPESGTHEAPTGSVVIVGL